MPFKVNIKTRVRFNGQEYDSVDAMPPEARAAYEAALARLPAAGIQTARVTTTTKIVFNGQEYASPDEMPAEARAKYEQLMGKFDANHNGVPDVLEGGEAPVGEVHVADNALALLMARAMSPEKRARYEAALREADARLEGHPEALELSKVSEFAKDVSADVAAQTQAPAAPRTPAPLQSPANFPVVSDDSSGNRRRQVLALMLLALLAGVAVLGLAFLLYSRFLLH